MAALARWCVRHRLVAVLLWLLAFAGTAAGAAVAGAAYSNDYKTPGTESSRATELLNEGFPGISGDSATVVWHTSDGTATDGTASAGAATDGAASVRAATRSARRHRPPPPSPGSDR